MLTSPAQTEPNDALSPQRLATFFHPRSIALVGATDRSGWSATTFRNWQTYSNGPAYLVHPVHQQVHGQPAYSSLSAIGEAVDLAYVMVPTGQVLPVIEEAGRIGIRNVVILTAGFAEMGEEGRELEHAMVDVAREYDMVLLGPNGNGFINAIGGCTPYGLTIRPPLITGPVGIVLQSGGLASSVLAMAKSRGIGVSYVVSTGNEAMVTATDVIGYLVSEEETRCIATFLESVRDPDEFRSVAERALDAGKPIVALKVGRTVAGQQAAIAHTGAVVGDVAVVRAALAGLGVVQVDSLEDLLTTAGFLGSAPARLGRRLAVVAGSGGACDIIADRATDEAIELPNFPSATVAKLRDLLPPYANPQNPLDVTGYVVMSPLLSEKALEVVLEDSAGSFDAAMYHLFIPPAEPPDPEPLFARLGKLAATIASAPVPVILQLGSGSAGGLTDFQLSMVERFGLCLVEGIEHGMTAIGRALWWQELHDRQARRPATGATPAPLRPPDATGTWGEISSRALLSANGVPVVPTRLVADADEAVKSAGELGYPVALKLASERLLHKSDIGAVSLDLRDGKAVRAAAEGLLQTATEHALEIDGLQVSPMRQGGTELLVSIKRDPDWGPVLVVGLGGIWVEVLGDTAIRLLPVTREDVEEMLDELRGAKLLGGLRGSRPADRASLVDAIIAVVRLGESLGDALDTLEINPMWAGPARAEALDALLIWSSSAEPPVGEP